MNSLPPTRVAQQASDIRMRLMLILETAGADGIARCQIAARKPIEGQYRVHQWLPILQALVAEGVVESYPDPDAKGYRVATIYRLVSSKGASSL